MQSDRGAAAVEFALVLIPLLMIVFGIISFGITFSDSLSLENAAREAARFGASYPVADAGSSGTEIEWLREVAETAEFAATGSLGTTVEGRVLCVAKGAGPAAAGFNRINVTGTAEVSAASLQSGNWCFDNDAPALHEVVQVQLQRDGWVEVIVFSAAPQLDGRSTARFER
jgi:Flp pilus assembly protein TadG